MYERLKGSKIWSRWLLAIISPFVFLQLLSGGYFQSLRFGRVAACLLSCSWIYSLHGTAFARLRIVIKLRDFLVSQRQSSRSFTPDSVKEGILRIMRSARETKHIKVVCASWHFEVTFPKLITKNIFEENAHKHRRATMRLLKGLLLLVTATAVSAASWSFEDGSITIASKGASEPSFEYQ